MADSRYGFTVGDHVVANNAEYDDFGGAIFVVTGFDVSLLGEPLVRARNIERPQGRGLVFYPRELDFAVWSTTAYTEEW